MQLINKSIDVLDQYMLPIDRQVHGLKVYFLYLFFFRDIVIGLQPRYRCNDVAVKSEVLADRKAMR